MPPLAYARFPRTAFRPADLILLSAMMLAGSQSVRAQTFSPYSDFQSMSLTQLGTVQVKLTYLGEQTASVVTVAFTPPGNAINMALFTPYRRPELDYGNDDSSPRTFSATTLQLKALIDGVGTLPDVTDGDVDPDGFVSFALLSSVAGTTKVFEAVANTTTGPALFEKMLNAVAGDAEGVRLLTGFGCEVHTLPRAMPRSLEGLVRIDFGGFRRDRRASRQFVGRVRVTNTSALSIAAPLSLVVIRHGNAAFLGGTGVTCNIRPSGFPYVDLPIGSGLAPGASVATTLRFANPNDSKLTVRFRAFAGPGTR